MENKFENYLISHLYSKLSKKQQISLCSELSDTDAYISRALSRYETLFKDYNQCREYIIELENQIKDLQKINTELRNERNFDLDNYKLIIAEIKDPETILAIAKAVLKHGKS